MEDKTELCIKMLLAVDMKCYTKPLLKSATDDATETLCGWKLVGPRPEYRPGARRKHKRLTNNGGGSRNGSTTKLPCVTGKGSEVMAGKLTEDFDYLYEGSIPSSMLATKVTENCIKPTSLILRPVILNRSESLSNDARQNIQRLASLQLKSDIAYEQLIIDEKLRSINLNSMCDFRINGILHDKPHSVMSTITPLKQTAKKPKKSPVKPLDWTNLTANQPPQFGHSLAKSKPVLKTSFSRFLESSSVVHSNKK